MRWLGDHLCRGCSVLDWDLCHGLLGPTELRCLFWGRFDGCFFGHDCFSFVVVKRLDKTLAEVFLVTTLGRLLFTRRCYVCFELLVGF